jgi:hypothetical protein
VMYRMVSALVVPLLAVLLVAEHSQAQRPELITLRPGSAVTIAPGQTTTVVCEGGLSRCVCTYNARPGEFSYELNWIVATFLPVTTTLGRYYDRPDCLSAMGQAPECQR